MAKLCKPDGEVLDVTPQDGKTFTLPELYKLVECSSIEIIRPSVKNLLMVIDEEGKFRDKKWNATATSIFREAGGPAWDHIVGIALVGTLNEIDGPVEIPPHVGWEVPPDVECVALADLAVTMDGRHMVAVPEGETFTLSAPGKVAAVGAAP